MKSVLDDVSIQIALINGVFFKHIFRADQSKIEKGLGRIHYEVLGALSIAESDNEIISLTELAKRLLISKAYTTVLTDKLVEENLIERHPDKKDRRVIKIVLTEKGKIALKEKLNESIEIYKKRLSVLNQNELEILSKSLTDIKSILNKIKVD